MELDYEQYKLVKEALHERRIFLQTAPYLSAMLRAILYGDDQSFWLEAYRRLDPISTPEAEVRFLEAAEQLFLKGKHPLLPLSAHSSSTIIHRVSKRAVRLASRFGP